MSVLCDIFIAKYPDLNLKKAINRLEGLFGELERKLPIRNKIMFIKDF